MCSYQGSAGVVLSGGKTIPPSAFEHHKTLDVSVWSAATGSKAGKHGHFSMKSYHDSHRDEDGQRALVEEEAYDERQGAEESRRPKPHRVVKRRTQKSTVTIMKVRLSRELAVSVDSVEFI